MNTVDTPRIVRIFVSSPGDVVAERRVLEEVVQEIKGAFGARH